MKNKKEYYNNNNDKLVKDKGVAEAATAHNEKVEESPTMQGSVSQDRPLTSVSNNETLNNQVIEASLDNLKTTPIDTPKLSMGVSANVANLYTVDGYCGNTFIGDKLEESEDDFSDDSNLMSIRYFEDMQKIDVLPDGRTIEDVFKNANDFRTTIITRPVICVQPLEFNLFGISSFKRDTSIVKKLMVFRLINLIARGQAHQLTDSDIFTYDDVTCDMPGAKSVSIPAFVQLYYMNLKIGIALQNMVMVMNSVKQWLIARSQDSMKRKISCDDKLAQWERSSNRAIRYTLLKQVNAFNIPGGFWSSLKESFISMYKSRSGLISPTYMTNFICDPETGDKTMDNITIAGQRVFTGDQFSTLIKNINTATWEMICWANSISNKYLLRMYDGYFRNSLSNKLTDIMQHISDVSTNLINFKTSMDSYDKVMNVFISAGFASDQVAVKEDEAYPSHNKPIIKLMNQLSYARANSVDVGVNVTLLADMLNVDKLMTHKYLSAFFEETAVDNVDNITRHAIVKPPKIMLAACSWYGSYFVDFTKAVPHMQVNGTTDGDNSGNDNIQLSSTCTTSNAFSDVIPLYTYPLSGTTGNGITKSPYYYGTLSVITGSMNESLIQYMLENILGGKNNG